MRLPHFARNDTNVRLARFTRHDKKNYSLTKGIHQLIIRNNQ